MDVILSREGADAQECDILVCGIFQDERPLKSTSGWIDWRFNGRLSRLVINQKITGEWKETTLMASHGRIAPRLILFLGLGKTKEYGSLRLRDLLPHLLETLRNLQISSLCLSLPYDDERYNIGCGRLIEVFLEGMSDRLKVSQLPPDEEWMKNLRLFFAEGEGLVSEILLGIQAGQSTLKERLNIRVLIPSDPQPKHV